MLEKEKMTIKPTEIAEHLRYVMTEAELAESSRFTMPVDRIEMSIRISKAPEREKEISEDEVVAKSPIKRCSQETFTKNLRERTIQEEHNE